MPVKKQHDCRKHGTHTQTSLQFYFLLFASLASGTHMQTSLQFYFLLFASVGSNQFLKCFFLAIAYVHHSLQQCFYCAPVRPMCAPAAGLW